MITTLLLSIFNFFFGAGINRMPTGHLDSQITTAVNWFFSAGRNFDFIIPVGTIIQVLVLGVVIDSIVLLIFLLFIIMKKVRGG